MCLDPDVHSLLLARRQSSPISHMSGLCGGSQLNWAALTKEAYATYMSVKMLPFYANDADITLIS